MERDAWFGALLAAGAAGVVTAGSVTLSVVPHDANRVFLRVGNQGSYGVVDVLDGSRSVGDFPRGSPNLHIFRAELWIGGITDPDLDAIPDTFAVVGPAPRGTLSPTDSEWTEGVSGFDRDDPRFRVIASTDPAFPAEPVADQELLAVFSDRFSSPGSVTDDTPVPSGLVVRQRSFAFDEPGLDSVVIFQWDVTNRSDLIGSDRPILETVVGLFLDPDMGEPRDDTAAPLSIDGEEVMLMWDTDFAADGFEGRPAFVAVVPLDVSETATVAITQLTRANVQGLIQFVPLIDVDQYLALRGATPREPTIRDPGTDIRALVGWETGDLEPRASFRTAAALVWSEPLGDPPAFLSPLDPALAAENPLLAGLVASVRGVREAYDRRLADLPAQEFPGELPFESVEGDGDELLQNFPNPFSDRTRIVYRTGEPDPVRLEVFDVTGRLVATLVSGRSRGGVEAVTWDGRAEAGFEVPAGIYVVRLETPRSTRSIRLLRVR